MAESNTETNWSYNPQDGQVNTGAATNPAPQQKQAAQAISWTASEFIDKHKGAGWYMAFTAGILALSIAVFLFTKDYISTGVIVFAGFVFILLIKKKPQQLPYQVNDQGIQIGNKFYQYGAFKSFDLGQDGGIKSIDFIPMKRFMPEVSIYFPPEQEEAIVNILSGHLPHSPQSERTVDKLAKKLRF